MRISRASAEREVAEVNEWLDSKQPERPRANIEAYLPAPLPVRREYKLFRAEPPGPVIVWDIG